MKDYIIATILCLAVVGTLASCTAPDIPEQSAEPSPAVSDEPLISDPTPSPTVPPTSKTASWDLFVYADGTMCIPSIGNLPGRYVEHTLNTVLYCMRENMLPCSEITRVCVGSAVLETEVVQETYRTSLNVRSATAYGHTITFDGGEMSMYGDFKFQAFDAKDCFILSKTKNGCGTIYIFTEEKVMQINTPFDNGGESYNASTGILYAAGGALYYERIPYKFCSQITLSDLLLYCVSPEELYREKGMVTLENGNLILQSIETHPISERDLDTLYSAFYCKAAGIDPNEITLDEFLAQNAAKYSPAVALSGPTFIETITVPSTKAPEHDVPDPETEAPDWYISVSAGGVLSGNDPDELVFEVINKLDYETLPCTEITKMIIGDVLVEVETSDSPYGHGMQARSVTAFGHTVEFADNEMRMYGNLDFDVIARDDCLVIFSVGSGGSNLACFMTEAGVSRLKLPVKTDGTDYNASVFHFYEEDGQLCYTRTIAKYCNIQYVGQLLEECVSRDELYRETGTVTFNGAEPVYHPTKTETVSDVHDLDQHYADYISFRTGNGVYTDPATLDEYLAQNALKYKEAH